MGKKLTEEQIRQYREKGYVFPIDCMSAGEANAIANRLLAYQAESGKRLGRDLALKGHLYFEDLTKLAQNKDLLDAVEDLIGPDILLFSTNFWVKAARDRKFVTWHQDSAYFGLDPSETVTAWVAFTDSTEDNGCVRVIPGSHLAKPRMHTETYHEDNLLARGQRIEDVDESTAVSMALKAGQFSLHHERTIHGSLANNSDSIRFGFAYFFIPTRVRSTLGRRTAWLVRGEDKYNHWDPDLMPECDQDPKIYAFMREAYERYVSRSVKQEATGMHA